MRRFFYDTEFMEEPGFLELISIGIVDEFGEKEFYACNLDADLSRANDWVKENVISRLPAMSSGGYEKHKMTPVWMPKEEIVKGVLGFLKPIESDPVELWGYYSGYDHVVLCWLFGRMIDLPLGMPMLTMDLKQELIRCGYDNKQLPINIGEHDALSDARWNRQVFFFINNVIKDKVLYGR